VDFVSGSVEILKAGRSLRVSLNARPVENKLRKAMLRSVLSKSGGDNYLRSNIN
jgi:hypothetical protein